MRRRRLARASRSKGLGQGGPFAVSPAWVHPCWPRADVGGGTPAECEAGTHTNCSVYPGRLRRMMYAEPTGGWHGNTTRTPTLTTLGPKSVSKSYIIFLMIRRPPRKGE